MEQLSEAQVEHHCQQLFALTTPPHAPSSPPARMVLLGACEALTLALRGHYDRPDIASPVLQALLNLLRSTPCKGRLVALGADALARPSARPR